MFERSVRDFIFIYEYHLLMIIFCFSQVIHKSEIVKDAWCVPFPGSDRSVVNRSQRFLFESDKKRPVQMKAYVAFRSLIAVFGVAFVGAIFALFARFSYGRQLLLKYPELFSFGFISHEGPKEEKMEKTHFSMTFYGEGWFKEEKLSEPTDQHTTSPTKNITTRVSGINPGYGATCIALLLSATTILNESGKMPGKGGVFPPGAAFAKTNLIKELSKNGFQFEVISSAEKTKDE